MLSRVRMEAIIGPGPIQHLGFGIGGIAEFRFPRMNVGQGNHRVRFVRPAQQILNRNAEPSILRNRSVVLSRNEAGHFARKPKGEKSPQMGQECRFGFPFDEDGNFQARAPRRPLLQSSSSEKSFSQ
jgi:hypothetical protein